MPFVGSAAVSGSEYVSNAQTSRLEIVANVPDGTELATRQIDITGMSRAVILVTQNTGPLGAFIPRVYIQGNAAPIPYPAVLMPALTAPVSLSLPVSARAMDLLMVAGVGGNSLFTVIAIMVSAASGT